jgi:hypothetical protein
VSFAAITLCVAFELVFIVAVYFVIDSVLKLLDTPSYTIQGTQTCVEKINYSGINSEAG